MSEIRLSSVSHRLRCSLRVRVAESWLLYSDGIFARCHKQKPAPFLLHQRSNKKQLTHYMKDEPVLNLIQEVAVNHHLFKFCPSTWKKTHGNHQLTLSGPLYQERTACLWLDQISLRRQITEWDFGRWRWRWRLKWQRGEVWPRLSGSFWDISSIWQPSTWAQAWIQSCIILLVKCSYHNMRSLFVCSPTFRVRQVWMNSL